ncbi:GNAT family N-acetyltransferase [Microbacterium sp. W1N]|uniref:GNAT family N-acetyltransferase n=1 Tax=Microbacterium festucae TaxID=2977531 RepID=UPI0021BF3EFB|nr:GNAT family N-acetyltransferase [Microbacterium festucae]MCT9821403.1 GNAT family N-acetyltransferase [Microbacterium festucae]
MSEAGDVVIRPIAVADAGQVLTIQRAAFVTEALIYGDPDMAPLTQKLEEVQFELRENLGCVAVADGRIVGAARAVADGALLLVGRIAIAPDQQGEGLGSRLLEAVEQRGAAAGCREAELFTGSLSEQNIALYEQLGYRERERVDNGDGTAQVFLRKALEAREPAA